MSKADKREYSQAYSISRNRIGETMDKDLIHVLVDIDNLVKKAGLDELSL